MNQSDQIREIENILKNINNAWLNGSYDDLTKYFHEEMEIIAPGFKESTKGREACIDSFREFSDAADSIDIDISDYKIKVWGATAVASYHFEIRYQMERSSYDESGRDLYVFSRDNDRWLAVWRTMIPNT